MSFKVVLLSVSFTLQLFSCSFVQCCSSNRHRKSELPNSVQPDKLDLFRYTNGVDNSSDCPNPRNYTSCQGVLINWEALDGATMNFPLDSDNGRTILLKKVKSESSDDHTRIDYKVIY